MQSYFTSEVALVIRISTADELGLNYRACVAIQDGDDPTALSLEPSEIPGGKYAKDRIRPWDYTKDVPELISRFEQMCQENETDPIKPNIEYYR